ncbi:MAG: hypothetical protein NVSMB49_27910 [Ktedonobacteraceae bacterium]
MQQQHIGQLDVRGLSLVFVAGAWLLGILLDALVPLPAVVLLLGAGVSLLFVFPLKAA